MEPKKGQFPNIREKFATETRGGLLSHTDKSKLDGILAGASRLATTLLDGLMAAADKALVAQLTTASAWTAPTFAANWTNQGTGATQAGYQKDALGRIVLKGLVAKTVALALPDTIFTLPAGYRPTHTQTFAAVSAAGYTAVQVNTAGAVFILAGGSASYTSLDGIRFDPAT